jgi:hypothetical protein
MSPKKEKDVGREVNSWLMLFAMFKEGEEVYVIDEDDKFHFGKFKPNMDYCSVGDKEIDWDKVTFMSHDGFPITWLKTGVPPDFFRNQDTTKIQERLRRLGSDAELEPNRRPLRRTSFRWGDPYDIEEVSVVGFNIGGPITDSPDCEFLKLTAVDGAVGLFYDIPSVFVLEAA